MGVAASHCPVLSLFSTRLLLPSFFLSCFLCASLFRSLLPILFFWFSTLFLSVFFLLVLSFRLSPSLFLHLANSSLIFALSFSLVLTRVRRTLFLSRSRPLSRVLSLRRGCLYSVFHCGSHTCPVAGWPSLACRRRRAAGLGSRGRDCSRAPSVGSVG